jgi:hypothetical protein
MKRIVFVFLLTFSLTQGYATIYYACGTGNNWDGITSFLYTTSDCSGTSYNPSDALFVDGDEIVIQPGAIVVISANLTLSDRIIITIYGKLLIQLPGGGGPGQLNLTNTSSTVVLMAGSVLACTSDGSTAENCSSSDQITVGTGGSKTTWKGSGIDDVNNGPRPVSLTNTGLPIELLSFKASAGLIKISISWATASELNFDYFDIEKSSDGKNFQSIAKVSGHGTTNERNDYSLEDEKPYIGKNYYRLKSVDFDGYTEYFNIMLVNFDGSKGFSIAPNPSDGVSFTTETNFVPQTRAYISVYTTVGAEIAHFEVYGDKSEVVLPVKLASGIYYAKYISGDFTATNRLVVR